MSDLADDSVTKITFSDEVGLPGEVDPRRLAELRRRLGEVRGRIAAAARAAGRDPAELTLLAVSKTRPAADVLALHALGVRDFAENREQEATPKVAAVTKALSGAAGSTIGPPDSPAAAGPAAARRDLPEGPVWHFVGQLQRNKARAVAGWAHWVHSVDRPRLVEALSRAATERDRVISVCIQVLLDPFVPEAGGQPAESLSDAGKAMAAGRSPGGRGGALPADVPALAELVARSEGLRLAGVMAVAPLGAPPRPAFALLRQVSERLCAEHPEATVISAGMSGDLEAAVAEGATHLRIGTALFGERPPVP